MFIDEVQDLTASTTFLLSKMVINNIFYCGDTAQAITKGVTFRFEDLKFIFNQAHCKNAIKLEAPKDIIYLTVNFRSHHFILQLANSIVSSI
jgi:superfamily I DNA/RNA helicase